MELTGNTILITGGTSGIGLGFAEELSNLGNKVIICGRRENRLTEISKKNHEIVTRKCDISIEKNRIELINRVIQNYPSLNIVINNAGIQTGQKIGNEIDLSKVHQEVETNFIAPVHICALMINHLKSKDNAAIINISSGLAYVPLAFIPIYCATKAGIHSFTMSLRHQLKDTNIKVFEIAPPSVDTELGQDRRTDHAQNHGGITVGEFIKDAIIALRNNEYEAAIGSAINLKEKKEQMFPFLNK